MKNETISGKIGAGGEIILSEKDRKYLNVKAWDVIKITKLDDESSIILEKA